MTAYYLVKGFLMGARIISAESNATLCQLQALELYNRTLDAMAVSNSFDGSNWQYVMFNLTYALASIHEPLYTCNLAYLQVFLNSLALYNSTVSVWSDRYALAEILKLNSGQIIDNMLDLLDECFDPACRGLLLGNTFWLLSNRKDDWWEEDDPLIDN